jgi:MscS family membrane protein
MRLLITMLALSLSLGSPLGANAQEQADAGMDARLDGGVDTDGGVPRVDLSTPRSAFRGFVSSMVRAAADRPELMDEAVRCLDVEWLEGTQNGELRARQLATELFEVLSSLDIVVDDVPNTSNNDSLALWQSAGTGRSAEALSISLVRAEEQWRFSRETLERLSTIGAAIQREVTEEDVDLQVRPALRSPRATMGTFLNAMKADPPDLDRAADCLEPPRDATSAWAVIRHDDAYRLYNVLLRVRAPALSDIPEHPQGRRYVWYLHEDGRIVLARIEQDHPDLGVWHGEWRFSRSTLATLADLYEAHAYDPILPEVDKLGFTERLSLGLSLERTIPEVLRVEALDLAIWKWFGILCLLILAVIVFGLGELSARLIYALLARIRQIETGTEDIERMSRAFGWLLMFSMLYRFIATNTLLLPAGLLTFIYPFSGAMVLAAFALFGLRLVQIAEHHYTGSKRVANLLLPLLESLFRLLLGASLIAFVLRLLGFSQAAVLGSLGILGAAVALAAQGSIANIVAAISIVYDRPFRVGDWVRFDGVDATVERLGFVSVRLRTLYNSLLVVPNAQIVTKLVDNYGERRYRRLRHFLRIRYDTPAAKIEALCEGLRELVLLHPYTRKDYYHVYLNELTPSSANILMVIFFEVPDWPTELRERHRFLIDALALVADLGIELAYPTQRLLIEEVDDSAGGERADRALPGPPEREGMRRARKLFAATYGDPPKDRGPVVMGESPLTADFDDEGDDGDGGGDDDQ